MLDFKNKYLKYKNKYLELKKDKSILKGGDLPIIKDVYSVNIFTDKEMEKYMNPIYGYILTKNDLLLNLYKIYYYCGEINFFSDDDRSYFGSDNINHIQHMCKITNKVCRIIPGTIQPTIELMNYEPINYGRYIGLKYINNKLLKDLITINPGKNKTVINERLIKKQEVKDMLIKCIDDIRKYIPFFDDDKFSYQMILFCMFWVSNNENGISQYYEGIKEVFDLIQENVKDTITIPPLVLTRIENPNSFEKLLLKNDNPTFPEFKLFYQEKAKNFCTVSGIKNEYYPDCGEITALNLINLIIYTQENFDITKLGNSPIPELIEFYSVFNNFDEISNKHKFKDIFGQNLNARDAWSYLIINYANFNLKFVKSCKLGLSFEINSGLSCDVTTSNLLQLIKNLLGIQKWEDLIKDNITNIVDKTINGVGSIIVKNKIFGEFEIHCKKFHYYIKNNNIHTPVTTLNPHLFTEEQINDYDILKKKNVAGYPKYNNLENLLKYTIDYNILLGMSSNRYLSKSIIMICLAIEKFSILQININLNIKEVNDFIYYNYYKTKKINDSLLDNHNFFCNDFSFYNNMPFLLNKKIEINPEIVNLDLSPLSCLEKLDYPFLSNLKNLTNIDLSPLSNITKISKNFLFNSNKLKNINLSPLSKISIIEDFFLAKNLNLEKIDLSPLKNIVSVENDFLLGCEKLTSVNLEPLHRIKYIKRGFLNNCISLKQINLLPLVNIEQVEGWFLYKCINLQQINLKPFYKINTIKEYFMCNCNSLTEIDLYPLQNVNLIEGNFMCNCENLNKIDLFPLSNVISIGNTFLYNNILTKIDLSPLNKINKFNSHFLVLSKNLIELDFSTFININEIDDDFLNNCSKLKKINLSGFKQVKIIKNNFINNCHSLEEINLSYLINVVEIGINFLQGCSSLSNYDLRPLVKLKSIGNNILNKQRNFRLNTIYLTQEQRYMIKTTNTSIFFI
jgi:hypothetical protein